MCSDCCSWLSRRAWSYSLFVSRDRGAALILLVIGGITMYFGRLFLRHLIGSRGTITAAAVDRCSPSGFIRDSARQSRRHVPDSSVQGRPRGARVSSSRGVRRPARAGVARRRRRNTRHPDRAGCARRGQSAGTRPRGRAQAAARGTVGALLSLKQPSGRGCRSDIGRHFWEARLH